ncbi:HemK methyltransferase member 1 [Mactra antiquata]
MLIENVFKCLRQYTQLAVNSYKAEKYVSNMLFNRATFKLPLVTGHAIHMRNYTSQGNTRLKDVLKFWTKKFSDEGVSEPQESVNLIVAHAMNKKMIHEVNTHERASEDIVQAINKMCELRLKRTPVQYVIKEWDFIDMTLEMCPPVLIPRPETEELASMVVNSLQSSNVKNGLFLEIGCGTGAVSLYILKCLPKMRCVAVDISSVACDLTLRNASFYDLQDRLTVIHGDAFTDATLSQLQHYGRYNIIVSNPPYITSTDMLLLQPEVKLYEDHRALYGGEDGLDIARNILQLSRKLLHCNGSVWLEVGLNQADKIKSMVNQNPDLHLVYKQTIQDFSKRDRFCKLSYQPENS